MQRFQGGLVFKAHRLVYHSTLDLRVIKKKKTVMTRWRVSKRGTSVASPAPDAGPGGLMTVLYLNDCLISGLDSLISGLDCLVSGLDCLISGLASLISGLDCLISGLDCLISGLACLICARFDLDDAVERFETWDERRVSSASESVPNSSSCPFFEKKIGRTVLRNRTVTPLQGGRDSFTLMTRWRVSKRGRSVASPDPDAGPGGFVKNSGPV